MGLCFPLWAYIYRSYEGLCITHFSIKYQKYLGTGCTFKQISSRHLYDCLVSIFCHLKDGLFSKCWTILSRSSLVAQWMAFLYYTCRMDLYLPNGQIVLHILISNGLTSNFTGLHLLTCMYKVLKLIMLRYFIVL